MFSSFKFLVPFSLAPKGKRTQIHMVSRARRGGQVLHCDLRRRNSIRAFGKEASSTAGVCSSWDDGRCWLQGPHRRPPQRADARQAEGPEPHLGPELEGSEIPGGRKARRATGETAEFWANAAGCVCDSLSATPPGQSLGAANTQDHKGPPGTANRKAGRVPGWEDKQINPSQTPGELKKKRHGRPQAMLMPTSSLLRAFPASS